MQQGGNPGRRRLRRGGVLAAGLLVLGLAAACTSPASTTHDGTGHRASGSGASPAPTASPTPTTSPTPQLAASITTLAQGGAAGVDPARPVVVKVAHGRLTDVVMTNSAGRQVTGRTAPDGASWTSTEALGYGKTYSVRASAVDASGRRVVSRRTITTLTPAVQTTPTFQRIGQYPLGDGATYGVAIVPVVAFDEPVTKKAAAERAIEVQTTPHVAGAWYWTDDEHAHWRPEHFWAPGTKVTIKADVYGVKLGHGLYGSTDASTSFTVGPRDITVAYDNAPKGVDKVKVYRSGRLVRVMNTAMGQHTGETLPDGTYINFYTPGGTYTVLDHENPAIMSSASYGLPADAPGGYAPEPIYWSTKISIDGIYLHYLDTTYDQNNGIDVSHGCLNLDHANAKWFFQHSRAGDPVIVHPAKGAPTVSIGEGGDWSVPWRTWVEGGAA